MTQESLFGGDPPDRSVCPKCGKTKRITEKVCQNCARSVFDAEESEKRKERGIALAASARADLLSEAQRCAFKIAAQHGEAHMDAVYERMELLGLHPENLGPSAGAVFRGREWVFTKRWTKSKRISNHSSDLRIWRLRLPEDPD